MIHCHSRGEEKTLTPPNLGDIFIIDAELDTSIFDSHCVLSFCFSSLQFPCYFSISMIYLNRLNFYMHISLFVYIQCIYCVYIHTHIFIENLLSPLYILKICTEYVFFYFVCK